MSINNIIRKLYLILNYYALYEFHSKIDNLYFKTRFIH